MKIAVTGSTGFIGTQLVASLRNKGFEVLEISRSKGIDITKREQLHHLDVCDYVVHLAAKTFVPASFNAPAEFLETNLTATLNALELARKWKAKLIYMSSYFYGPPQYVPVDEAHPINPHNPYAQSKYLSEELCKGYHRDFDIDITSFRLFNIYGPKQEGQFLIPEILEKIKLGKLSLKDPRPKRDYIHIQDVVDAVIVAINKSLSGFNVFNLGTGHSYSVEDLVNMIYESSPIKFEVEFTHEYRKGEVLDSIADITKIKEKLGWEPALSLNQGIASLF